MKRKIRIIQVLILVFIGVSFSCSDLLYREDTDYYLIDWEVLMGNYDQEEENNTIVDVKEINKFLNYKVANRIIDIANFKVSVPINYTLRESKPGKVLINFGDFKIDSRHPDFKTINATDINVDKDMVFMDFANFYYMPVKDSTSITIDKVLEHIKKDIAGNTVFHTDHKSYVIYGNKQNFNVVHINYLAPQKTAEIFVSYQKHSPFSDESSRDLFSLALSKVRLAKNFHITKDTLSEDESWQYLVPTMSRYHRKMANIIFDNIKELPASKTSKKKIEIEVPDFDLKINIDRRQKVDTIYQDFKKTSINDTISLTQNTSLKKTTTQFLRHIFNNSEVRILNKDKKMFLLSDGEKSGIIFFYKYKNTSMFIYFTDHKLYEGDDIMDMIFEMLKHIDTGIDVFY